MVQSFLALSQESSRMSRPLSTLPPRFWILREAASHIMPGPLRGYWKLSISVLTTGPPAFGARLGSSAFFSASITATPRSSPLMRCAAQSAEISSHDMPHTFSV